MFFLSLCMSPLVSLPMRLCKYNFLFFCLNVCQFLCLSLFVCLFVCLAATLLLSLYSLSVFTVIVSFDFITKLLFLSIITHHLLFHFFICPLWENSRHEFECHGLALPVRYMGKLLKVSTHYFILFVSQKITFCFCLL